MALIDDVTITVKAGNGGNGGTATKQLYATKKTAPDGGNGGNGGNVYFLGDSNVSDLSEFMFKKKIKAENGINGSHKDLDGAKGEDTYIKVPLGTSITDTENNQFVEILTTEPFCVAYGGRGGIGNHDYKLDLRHAKSQDREGEQGEERVLHLVLRLIADIGLVGMPNAGKSSLLEALTNAKPKIGNYPFTTLEPNLGALGKIILADIPGLIEGASEGKGLGIQFLKHIKKTKVLFHCVDATLPDTKAAYESIRDEFEKFDSELAQKKELILVTKTDLASKEQIDEKVAFFEKLGKEVLLVSVYDEGSITTLQQKIESLFESESVS